MPNTKNISVQYNKQNATLNKIGGAATLVSVVIAVAFPPLAIFGLIAAGISGCAWYYAGSKTAQYAKDLDTQDAQNEGRAQKDLKKKAKLEALQSRIQHLENEHYWAEQAENALPSHHWTEEIQRQRENSQQSLLSH